MVFSIVILSPYGYHGLVDASRISDASKQVMYIFDRVHAL